MIIYECQHYQKERKRRTTRHGAPPDGKTLSPLWRCLAKNLNPKTDRGSRAMLPNRNTTWATYVIQNFLVATFYLCIYFLMFIFERDRARAWTGEGQREREIQNPKQALGSISTEADMGLEPTNREIMTWAEVWRTTNRAAQAPLIATF